LIRLEPAVTRGVAPALALLLFAGSAREARGQQESPAGVSTQIWANFTSGWTKSERLYLELDVEPKIQVTSGEQWRNLDLTPLVEYYPSRWLDLEGEATVGRTRQRDGLDTWELTPRVGARLHFVSQAVRQLSHERLPLTRFDVSTLVRLEWRNFFYSDGRPSEHAWRARARLESKLAINHRKLADDRTLYAIGDVEYYEPFGADVEERFVNKVRTRLGLGFRLTRKTRFDLLYIRDWNRSAPGASTAQDAQIVDARLKLLF
jgi:hypothetical protein